MTFSLIDYWTQHTKSYQRHYIDIAFQLEERVRQLETRANSNAPKDDAK